MGEVTLRRLALELEDRLREEAAAREAAQARQAQARRLEALRGSAATSRTTSPT
jgi:hypothetical protein